MRSISIPPIKRAFNLFGATYTVVGQPKLLLGSHVVNDEAGPLKSYVLTSTFATFSAEYSAHTHAGLIAVMASNVICSAPATRQGSCRCAAVLRAEARQRQHAASRKDGRSGNRRGGEDDESRSAGTSIVPGSIRWRRAKGHPLSLGKNTRSRYAGGRHIGVSRRVLDKDPIDEAFESFGLERGIVVAIVGGFSTALALA
jgi:hypothetical protein